MGVLVGGGDAVGMVVGGGVKDAVGMERWVAVGMGVFVGGKVAVGAAFVGLVVGCSARAVAARVGAGS